MGKWKGWNLWDEIDGEASSAIEILYSLIEVNDPRTGPGTGSEKEEAKRERAAHGQGLKGVTSHTMTPETWPRRTRLEVRVHFLVSPRAGLGVTLDAFDALDALPRRCLDWVDCMERPCGSRQEVTGFMAGFWGGLLRMGWRGSSSTEERVLEKF